MSRVTAEPGPLVGGEYDYDGLGRLIEARDYDPVSSVLVETREYSFDANTNRTALTATPAGGSPSTTSYQIASDGSDRLVSVDSGTALSYDGNGNTVVMPGRSMVWNAANRLVSATAGSVTVEYGLDPLGRTLTRSSTGGTADSVSEYHYSADADTASWVSDTVNSVETVTRYVNGGGLLASEVVGGEVSVPLYTPHGDTWAWTDETGAVTGTSVWDEYGNPGQAPSGEPGVDRYGWLGRQQRESDPDLSLTLMGVRGYDPALGRFLTVDPIRGGSANDYDYTAGDPINGYDVNGQACWNPFNSRCRKALINRLRFLKNAPWSAIAFAWARRNGGSCAHRTGGMIVCAGMKSGYGLRAGITVGNVFLTKLKQSDVDAALLRHEAAHATQWAYLGTLMPQTYLLAQLAGTCHNWLEVAAGLLAGRYTSC